MARQSGVLPRTAVVAVLALLAQCAGGPSLQRAITVQPGQVISVTFTQLGTGQSFGLRSGSPDSARDYYADRQSDQTVKIVDDETMQRLLDVLATEGMFARAAPMRAPDARDLLTVQQGEQRWIWSRKPAPDVAELQAFNNSMLYVMGLYNGTTAYHRGRLSAEDLANEKARVEAAAESARQKAAEQGPPK